jgi:2-keto-4-pentenoate hydratase/2-oxohepta-3-ene-1,7-dioic acid hydratase in catechol pathway
MTLFPGDLVLTGTPSGVGPIKNGDKVEAYIYQNKTQKLAEIVFNVKKI